MKSYEAMFIFQPQLSEENLEKEIEKLGKLIKTKGKGETDHEMLGKKTLAYPIKKVNEGFYVNYKFKANASAIEKIKAELKHSEEILRYIIFLKEG